LDRFMFNLLLDYPSYDEEVSVVRSTTGGASSKVQKVITAQDIITYQDLVRRVPVADNVIEYAVKMVRATRPAHTSVAMVKNYISYGAGPRASQYLVLGAKSRAALHGRFTPSIEDVHAVALSVLRHRIVTNFTAEAEGVTTDKIIQELIKSV